MNTITFATQKYIVQINKNDIVQINKMTDL